MNAFMNSSFGRIAALQRHCLPRLSARYVSSLRSVRLALHPEILNY